MSSPGLRRIWAVVPAAGRGERFQKSAATALPKQYANLLGRTVFEWTLATLIAESRIAGVVVALSKGDEEWPKLAARLQSKKIKICEGGAQRQESVLNGVRCLSPDADEADWVLVHDAARPCLSGKDLGALIDALDETCAGALLAAPVADTMKREADGKVSTVDRTGLWRALTPQAARVGDLKAALESAVSANVTVTDEAQALERLGMTVRLVAGSPFNIKVTRLEDLHMAEQIMGASPAMNMRIGQGTDVHTFGPGDHVVLGGVRIAHSMGIVAHSDGDVIIHALCDAILGALGDGDIGQHFPDTDPKYRGADSRVFLRVVRERMEAAGFRLVNADVTVLAEAPRVNPHRAAMVKNLAEDMKVDPHLVNIKATTTEKLGFIGRKEGLAAQASVLLAR